MREETCLINIHLTINQRETLISKAITQELVPSIETENLLPITTTKIKARCLGMEVLPIMEAHSFLSEESHVKTIQMNL